MNWPLLVGSLGGVLMLAAAAKLLGLGPAPRIGSEEQALAIALEHGFDGVRAMLTEDGHVAIVTDRDGHSLSIRAHGVHFVTERRA